MDPDPRSPARARAARVGISAVFFVNGAFVATVLPRLPAIKDSLGLTNGELGAAVAAMPVGGLLAGGFAGVLIARFGSGRVAMVAGILTPAMLVPLGLANSWATLTLAFLVTGLFDATMDAAMNAHSIGVQRQYGRSILQGFHGMWSIGNVAAGAAGALAAAAGVPVAVAFAIAAVVLAGTALVAGTRLLPASVADAARDGEVLEPIHLREAPRLLRILFPIAMLGILCAILQSSAQTWSAVYLSDVLLAPEGIAAGAFVVYMAAMVVGRLTNDRWVDRWGSLAIVRGGAVLASIGVLIAMAAAPLASVPAAYLGFAMVGLGSSSLFPVMVGAAGSRPGIPAGHGIAICIWLVRSGLIVAPALIGATADAWGLAAALGIPLAAGVAIAVFATPLTGVPRRRRAPLAVT